MINSTNLGKIGSIASVLVIKNQSLGSFTSGFWPQGDRLAIVLGHYHQYLYLDCRNEEEEKLYWSKSWTQRAALSQQLFLAGYLRIDTT